MWSLSLIKKCKKVSRILRWQPPPPTWSSGAARKYQPFKKISILCGWVGSVVNVDIVSKFRDIWQSGWVCPASNVDIVSKTSGKVANHSETGLSYWESNFHQEAGMEKKTEDVQARKRWTNKIKLKVSIWEVLNDLNVLNGKTCESEWRTVSAWIRLSLESDANEHWWVLVIIGEHLWVLVSTGHYCQQEREWSVMFISHQI